MLVHQLPYDSATARAQNGNKPVWSMTDHLVADVWSLILSVNSEKGSPFVDNPRRVQMEQAAHMRDKQSRFAELRATFNAKKAAYGMDVQQ